jgi:hypothetical protein
VATLVLAESGVTTTTSSNARSKAMSLYYQDLSVSAARQHIDELLEEASRYRLAAALRRGRRQLWPESRRASGPDAVVGGSGAEKKETELVGAVSRLAACEGQQTSPRGAEEPVGTAPVR